MKPIEVPDYEDERVYIPFTVPQKGRKAVEFKVPRRDFQPREDVQLLQWLMAELDYDEDKLSELVDPTEPAAVEKACFLLALKPHVSAAQFKALKQCSYGQLRFIYDRWNEQSRVTLGEYWASASSSKSMGRPSKQTSSPADGDSSTSDDDSDGQSSAA